jgi:hypothetical protein
MQFIELINKFVQKTQELKAKQTGPSLGGGAQFIVDAYQTYYFSEMTKYPQTEKIWQDIKYTFLNEAHSLDYSKIDFNDANNMFFFHIDSFIFFKENGFDFSLVKDNQGFSFQEHIKQLAVYFAENQSHRQDGRLMYNHAVKSVILELTKKEQCEFFHYHYLNTHNFSSTYHFDQLMSQEELNLGLKLAIEFDKPKYIDLYLEKGGKVDSYIESIQFEVKHVSEATQIIYEKLLFDYQTQNNSLDNQKGSLFNGNSGNNEKIKLKL